MRYGRHPYQVNLTCKKNITLDTVKKIVNNKSVKCLLALISNGWDINTSFVKCTKDFGTMSVAALHLAIQKDWCDGVAALVERGASVDVATVPVEIGINGGICVSRKWFHPMYTPLMLAAEKGCVRCLETLIKANAKVNYKDNITKTTALRLAVFKGHVACVKALLKAKADVNIIGDPLYFPVTSQRTSFYSYCPCSALITAMRHFNGTIHLNAMTSSTSPERFQRDEWLNVIKELINNGCDVNYTGSHLETMPLIEAVESNDTRVLELLLRHGAQTNVISHVQLQTSPRVSTALDLACYSHNFHAVQLLIEYGAAIHDISIDLFQYIVEKQYLDIVTLLMLAGYTTAINLKHHIPGLTGDFISFFTSPWSLKALCRRKLRIEDGLINKDKVERTGLPTSLQNYVLCKII